MKISQIVGGFVLLVVIGASQFAQAQGFGIRIGGAGGGGGTNLYFGSGGAGYYPGGGYYGPNYGGYGGGYGGYGNYGYGGYPYGYGGSGLGVTIAPRASSYYYSQPQTQYYDYAPATQTYLPEVAVPPPYTGPGIVINFPAGDANSIKYRLDEKWDYEMKTGEKQKLPEKGTRVIEFDRGGDFGTAKYTLSEGTYEFHLTEKGWDVWKVNAATPVTDSAAPVEANKVPTNPLPGEGAKAKEL